MTESKSSSKKRQQLLEKYDKELKEFEAWITTKSHYPQNLGTKENKHGGKRGTEDKLLLLRFLKIYDFDLEKAKNLLSMYLEMRMKNPAIFHNRDVLNDAFQQAFKTYIICPMPKTTEENHKLSVFRLTDPDPEKYVYLDVCRAIVSMMDTRFVTVDDNELINGEIGIVDMTGFSFKHFMKSATHLSIMRSYMKYVQEDAPFKIVQNHFINCSPMMDRFISFLKPFIKKEVFETMKFHTSLESLYDTFSRDLLPNEFGGSAGSIEDIYQDWIKVVESKREYLLNDDNWKLADE